MYQNNVEQRGKMVMAKRVTEKKDHQKKKEVIITLFPRFLSI